MSEAEEQELFARVEKLERSAWRWRWFASVLAVFFLLLLSLGLVSFVAVRKEAMLHARLVDVEDREAAKRARAEADRQRLEELERLRLEPAPHAAPGTPRRMPRAEGP